MTGPPIPEPLEGIEPSVARSRNGSPSIEPQRHVSRFSGIRGSLARPLLLYDVRRARPFKIFLCSFVPQVGVAASAKIQFK